MAQAKKSSTGKTRVQQEKTIQSKPVLNTKLFFEKYNRLPLLLFIVIFCLFCFSVFKNIRYPLFWADESITAVGGQRVLQYGYPKVHDGKNVFYDLRHSNVKLGIDEKTDAYVGGTAWFHYYIAAMAIKIASLSNDIYTQTGIIRDFFACIGIAGILFFVFLLFRFFDNRFSKFLFAFLFLSLCLFSIPLTLLLREVRYYSPNIFLVCFVAGYYVVARFLETRKVLFAIVTSISLLLLFHTFSPAYFIMVVTLCISEAVLIFSEWLKKDDLKYVLLKNAHFLLPVVVSLIGIAVSLPYFRTFAIAREMAIFNADNSGTFSNNIQTVFSYFRKFEIIWLAIPAKVLILLKCRELFKRRDPKLKASLFLSLLFIIYCVAITRIPNFIYTRYFSPAIVLLDAILLLDLFCLNQFYQPKTFQGLQFKIISLSTIGVFIFGVFFFQNNAEISGHIQELSDPFKGPLDYTIPYIKEKYKRTDSLVIATNYEESSYMFYLNSKTIIGFAGNNLQEDTLLTPDVISIRKKWAFNREPMDNLLKKAHYSKVSFPVQDITVNNIPEFNFMEDFNHLFETPVSSSDEDATDLYIKQ